LAFLFTIIRFILKRGIQDPDISEERGGKRKEEEDEERGGKRRKERRGRVVGLC
jgi:hypothetical protein